MSKHSKSRANRSGSFVTGSGSGHKTYSGYGKHADRRTKRARTRNDAKRAALRDV